MFTVIRVSEGGLLNRFEHKGYTFGACMTTLENNLMYVQIPKNASTWTKFNLNNLKWEDFNYHYDHLYKKHALVVLRDPVSRWLSGVCEYFSLHHPNIDTNEFNKTFYEFLMDQIVFDDHTEHQHYFIDGLSLNNITFFFCNDDYRLNFDNFFKDLGIDNSYHQHDYQHTTEGNIVLTKFKKIFQTLLLEPKYLNKIKDYYKKDYALINSVNFYAR